MNQPPGRDSAASAFSVVLVVWTVVLLLVSAGAALVIVKRYREARQGWNLVPVVVVAVDVPAREAISMEVLSQRSIPEQFVTGSVVRPDEASKVLGRRVRAKVLAGDPLLWRDLLPVGAPAPAGDEADGGAASPGSP